MAEVSRVVARLLERAEHERREGVPSPPRPRDVVGHRLARGSRQAGRRRRGERLVLRHRRRRHLQVGEAREEKRDRLRVRPFVDAEERLSATAREQARDRLVRQDHQLLDERVRARLLLAPGALDAAAAVEGEGDLAALDPQGAARETAAAELAGELVGELERRRDLRLRVAPLRLRVGEPGAASDRRPVEERLPRGRQLDRDAEPVLVRSQAAEVVRELGREHRRHPPRHVDRVRPLGCSEVERRPGRDEVRHVRDVHPRADPLLLAAQRERIVEVLRRLRVDGERELLAQVDAALEARLRRLVRLEGAAQAALHEQPLERRVDRLRGSEHALDARSPPARPDDDEVARVGLAESLPIEDERNARREERFADDELAASRDLDDDEPRVGQGPLRCGGSGGA